MAGGRPPLPRDERYPATWEDAVAAVRSLKCPAGAWAGALNYRISAIRFDEAEWAHL